MANSVFITGASDGIGKSLALAFARRGFKLGLLARRREKLEAVAEAAREVGAPEARIYAVDVLQSAELRQALADFDERVGGMDYFIANAGVDGNYSVRRDSYAEVSRVMGVNVLAAIDGIEWAKARMVERGRGVLVGVSSVAGARGLPTGSAYSASKAALHTYLESLRIDLKRHGVQVVEIAPGFIKSEMTRKNRFPMPFLMDVAPASEVFARGILKKKATVVAPWQFRLILPLLRKMPDWLYRWIGALVSARMSPRESVERKPKLP